MKPVWYWVSGLLIVASVWGGVWRFQVMRNAPDSIKRLCAHEPITLDPKQYSNCIIRHM